MLLLPYFVVALLGVPLAVFAVELLLALPGPRRRPLPSTRPRLAVLVPAHDEEAGIAATLAEVRAQLAPGDRLVVVADNCTDATAAVARAAGAEAVERADATRRGKGFALDFGLRYLAADPPAVVAVVDADCRLGPGCLDSLARAAHGWNRPVQAAYTMLAPPGAGPRTHVAAFTFWIKNVVRPTGLDRLGLPCLLGGSGMAFSWETLSGIELATGEIVEDMRLGIELALAGKPPRLLPLAEVFGELPTGAAATRGQRRRWEHGHIASLLRWTPRLLWSAVRRGRLDLLGLALELSVPPMALLLLLSATFAVVLAGVGLLTGDFAPAITLGGLLGSALSCVFLTWLVRGRDRLPVRAALAAPLYVVAKVPLYFAFLVRPEKRWVRTDRAPPTV